MLPNDKKRKGTGFTNIANILGANKGSRLGETITSGVGGVAKETRAGLEKAGKEFETKVSGSLPSQKEEEELKQLAVGFETPSGTSGMGADQGGYQRERQKFSDYLGKKYEGPKEIENKERLQSSVAQTEELGRLGETTGGRQELLRRFVGGRDYTRGEQALDTALLGATGQQELSKAARETKGLGDVFSRVIGRTEGLAKKATSELEQSQENVKKQVQKSLGNIIEKEVNPLLTAAQKREKSRSNLVGEFDKIAQSQAPAGSDPADFQNNIKNQLINNLNEAKNAGFINQGLYNTLLGPDQFYGNFLNRLISQEGVQNAASSISNMVKNSPGAQNVTAEGVAQEETAARLAALQKIINQNATYADRKEYKEGSFVDEGTLKDIQTGVLNKEIDQKVPEYNKLNSKVSAEWWYSNKAPGAKWLYDLIKDQKYSIKQKGDYPMGNEGTIDIDKYPNSSIANRKKMIQAYNEAVIERNKKIQKELKPLYDALNKINPSETLDSTQPSGNISTDWRNKFRDPRNINTFGIKK